MSGFSADWLALREPYDLAARSALVLDSSQLGFFRSFFVSLVDLACGTGSTLRALTKHLPARQEWRLADNDLGLLLRAGQKIVARREGDDRPRSILRAISKSRSMGRSRSSPRRLCSISCHSIGWTALWSKQLRASCRSMRR